jgi:hypothetical protein
VLKLIDMEFNAFSQTRILDLTDAQVQEMLQDYYETLHHTDDAAY